MRLCPKQPWLAPIAPWLARLPAEGCVAAKLRALRESLPTAEREHLPQFVPAADTSSHVAYEAYIADTRQVPSRDNAHDLFNGLMWFCQPQLKWRLNALQAQAIRREGITSHRGPLRDALTLFDENGAIWVQPEPVLLDAWRRREWQTLFVEHRALWARQRFWVFGHALLAQLHESPRKGLTAHVLVLPYDEHKAGHQAEHMDEQAWASKPFGPMPVAGVPGWWSDQDHADFYSDVKVFRPAPTVKPP